MATFVLVHGSYQGGWIWQKVANRLRAAGHQVYAPSLDGCGERKGTVRPGITTETQADEVAQLLFYEDLKDVVMVGTSSGGMVVCRVAELMRERVGRLAFVDALALLDGEKIRDIVTRSTASASGGGLTAGPSREDAANRLFADLDPTDARLGARALYPAPDRHLRPSGQARFVLVAAMAGNQCDLVPPRAQPGGGAPAPRLREARRQVGRARHRALSDAEHARRADPAVSGLRLPAPALPLPAACRSACCLRASERPQTRLSPCQSPSASRATRSSPVPRWR